VGCSPLLILLTVPLSPPLLGESCARVTTITFPDVENRAIRFLEKREVCMDKFRQGPEKKSTPPSEDKDVLRATRHSLQKIREDFSTAWGDTVQNQRETSKISGQEFFKSLYRKGDEADPQKSLQHDRFPSTDFRNYRDAFMKSLKERQQVERDNTHQESQKLEQQHLHQSKGDVASQKLDGISPAKYRSYEWLLRQKDPRLMGEELEKAIWELHEQRQEKDSYPGKTVVAPDKSETRTLVDQISHWSSSDTLLRQDEVLTKQNREELRESFRSLVQEYRQEGNVRSTAPTFRNMTEGQILLEALSHSDCLDRLQDKAIQVNKPILEFIHHMLTEMQMKSPMPSDYNPAVEKFNKAASKFESKDVAALHVEPVHLDGGGYIVYDYTNQRYYGRTMKLRDPHGRTHVINKGQPDNTIADYTGQIVNIYRNHYGTQKAREYVNYYKLDPQLIPQYTEQYKAEYNSGAGLTTAEVAALREGNSLKGWRCTQHTFTRLPKHIYYTDKGNEISALDLSLYQPYSIREHNAAVPHPPIDNPTSRFNCFSEFVHRRLWLFADPIGNQIQKILDDNGYYHPEFSEINDLVICRQNGIITHLAIIVADENTDRKRVESKPGDWGLTKHDLDDPWFIREFGTYEIYHTDRGSHLLRTTYP
jgi:hypothetical protein